MRNDSMALLDVDFSSYIGSDRSVSCLAVGAQYQVDTPWRTEVKLSH